MRALVTGGGGFLGRYIVEQLLARGDEVTVFARGNYPELVALGARLIRGDIRDRAAITAACRGIETVFHTAALEGMWGHWMDFYTVNVGGTENVLAACEANEVVKLIYTSSPSVIFDNQPHEAVNEYRPYPLHYESPYAQTKAMAEQLVHKAGKRNGLLTVSLRPHLIWGPRDTHLLPALIARAQAGQLVQVGEGTNRVDLTFVEDAARAHLLAADALKPKSSLIGSIYFISQDEPVLLWPWISDLLRDLGLPPIRRHISLQMARTAGAFWETVYRVLRLKGEPRITRFLASELALSHYYDISRAKSAFDYAPQFTMAQAREKTLAWLAQQNGIGLP